MTIQEMTTEEKEKARRMVKLRTFVAMSRGELEHDDSAACEACAAFMGAGDDGDFGLDLLYNGCDAEGRKRLDDCAQRTCDKFQEAMQASLLESMIQRRMENTKETHEEAKKQIEGILADMEADNDQSWVEDWSKPTRSLPEHLATADWMRTLPKDARALVIAFPPGATVRTKDGSFRLPKDGSIGVVTGYSKPCEQYPDGVVEVRQRPDGKFAAHIPPKNLEVVGHRNSLTSDVVRRLFASDVGDQPS